ncbi:MAG: hypothetical protein ABR961_13535 [Thermoanaerobaculaceae bacterium]
MSWLRRAFKIIAVVLAGFLGVSAVPGGIALLAGIDAPPVEQLKGSVFADYTIPGLSLLLIVGGSAVLATVLLIRKSRFAVLASIGAGLGVMVFEFVEVLVIGSPAGPARILQVLYFGVGVALVAVSVGLLLVDVLSSPSGMRPD